MTARRTAISVYIEDVDVTASVTPYLLSLSYTDNEEGETDDLQVKFEDRDGTWLKVWLNKIIEAAAMSDYGTESGSSGGTGGYTVCAKAGVNAHSRAGEQYYVYGSLSYGASVSVKSISGGWANITYDGKNAYVPASALSRSGGGSSSDKNASEAEYKNARGLKIKANINGESGFLDCGQFELDDISYGGPPSVVNLKGTSLPYSSSARQTKKSKSWEKYYLSKIADEIAQNSGMTCMYLSEDDPYYERTEQYNVSDIAFLEKLCHNSGKSLKVTNNIIVIFEQSEYEGKEPSFSVYPGCGYTKYSFKTEENDKYNKCRVSYVDGNGKLIEATATTKDKDGKDKQTLEIHQKVNDKAEAQALAEKLLRLHNKLEKVISFTLPGNTNYVSGITGTVSGFGLFDGKYIIKQAKHEVSKSGYTTSITLRQVWEDEYESN